MNFISLGNLVFNANDLFNDNLRFFEFMSSLNLPLIIIDVSSLGENLIELIDYF
jgi:hypothetical protein